MKVVVAIDSFKGSLTSEEAGNAAKEGILRAIPEAEVIVRPMADGGEGTVDALAAGRTLQRITAHVTGPLGMPAEAQYVILDGSIAVMEMSRAAGITMVPRQNLDPRRATTFGVGEMIIDANFSITFSLCSVNFIAVIFKWWDNNLELHGGHVDILKVYHVGHCHSLGFSCGFCH